MSEAEDSGPRLVETSQFESRADALNKIRLDKGFEPWLKSLLMPMLQTKRNLTGRYVFVLAAMTRTRSLYEAIVREIEAQNRDAVQVLLRQY